MSLSKITPASLVLALALLLLSACTVPNETGNTHHKTAEPTAIGSDSFEPADDVQPKEGQPKEGQPKESPKTSKSSLGQNTGQVDYTCTTDADCTVKDVGNCCGYYPACVNVDSPTFPEQVKAACAASGDAGICGFPDIKSCTCEQGRCKSQTSRFEVDELQ